MTIKYRSYFHPVLSKFSNDYGDECHFEVKFEPILVPQNLDQAIHLKYDVDLRNAALRDLLMDGRALLAFVVHCSQTMFRSFTSTSDLSGTLELPVGSCVGAITVQPILLTAEQGAYQLEGIHSDYHPTKIFQLEKGSVLALAEVEVIEIEFARRAFQSMIMLELDSTQKDEEYAIYVESSRITVLMGPKVHDAWNRKITDQRFNPFLYAGILKDCLVEALYYMAKASPEELPLWAAQMESRLERIGVRTEIDSEEFNEVNKIALRLLEGRTYSKVLDDVD